MPTLWCTDFINKNSNWECSYRFRRFNSSSNTRLHLVKIMAQSSSAPVLMFQTISGLVLSVQSRSGTVLSVSVRFRFFPRSSVQFSFPHRPFLKDEFKCYPLIYFRALKWTFFVKTLLELFVFFIWDPWSTALWFRGNVLTVCALSSGSLFNAGLFTLLRITLQLYSTSSSRTASVRVRVDECDHSNYVSVRQHTHTHIYIYIYIGENRLLWGGFLM